VLDHERNGDRHDRRRRSGGERRAHRAAEAAIANPLFDDASLNGARGVLISITGGNDLTLYEVDEAASRIRQEVDEEANIIVGAIIEPALEQAMRVSVVATGIDQSASCRMAAQSFAEPVLPPNVAPPSLDRTARAPVSAVESRPPIAAGTEFETPSPRARHPISRADGAASDSGRGHALRSASNSTAVRWIGRRSVGKATGSKSVSLNQHWAAGDVGSMRRERHVQFRSTRPAASIGEREKLRSRAGRPPRI
jgi:FtsZ family, C-terminal domain